MVKAIEAACHYHCARSFEDPNGYPEFAWEPYNVFPVDILAIRRVRDDLGLGTPDVHHPLLDSLLNKVPVKPPEIQDDILKIVRTRASQELPRIGDPW